MPAQSVWMIRLSLLWFLIAVLTGGFLFIHKELSFHPAAWVLLPIHFETAIWGWIVQLVMGTAYWIFPRHLEGSLRGPEKMGWLIISLYNIGLIVLLSGQVLPLSIPMELTGRFLMVLSIALFGRLIWGRVKSYADHKH
jgi:cbb3-type cytochrome oxidase subunit 1